MTLHTKRTLRLTPKGLALLQTMARGEGDTKGRLEGPEFKAPVRRLLADLEALGYVRAEYDGMHERPRAFVLTSHGETAAREAPCP